MLTVDQLVKVIPANLRSSVDQSLVDTINHCVSDPMEAEQVRNNYLSYIGVLKDGKYKMDDYLNAVVYVGYKLMGDSNQDAWCKTFPQRYQALVTKGKTKDVHAHVSAYAKGKLVNQLIEQSMIPSWILNQDLYQRALNTQAQLMVSAVSEKVRSDAANSILTHLAKPKENIANQINIGIGDASGIGELKDTLAKLAQQQQNLINSGVTTREIAAQSIIDVEAKEHVTR